MKNILLGLLKKFKLLILTIFISIGLILTVHFDLFKIKTGIYKKYPNLFLRHFLLEESSIYNNVFNDYNVRFLPNTQFLKLNLSKKRLIFDEQYYNSAAHNQKSTGYSAWGTFYLENYNNKLVITDYNGSIYYHNNLDDVLNNYQKEIKLQKIENNLNPIRVFDTFIYKDKLFISHTTKENGCKKINISVAKFNLTSLKFKDFFSPKECNETGGIGRMQFFIHQNEPGILVTTMEGMYDVPGVNAQKDESVFGKTVFINLKNLNFYNFSKGHRVSQGLYASTEKNLILATEHGPRGGDEINKIIFNRNYGWPISSYGERYDFNYEKKPHYKKSHKLFGFEEPIYTFHKGLGISEILMLKKDFSNFFSKDVLVISSLGAKSIFFANFDDKFNRILSLEKIFLKERVRDLKYHSGTNSILLAFEENGELGILSSEN